MKKLQNLVKKHISRSFGVFMIVTLLANLLSSPTQVPAVYAAGPVCTTSTSPSGTYTVTPCLTGPASGVTIIGNQVVTANYSTTGANPGVAKLIFFLGGQYLITDYVSPYSFILPSTKFVDGTYTLGVEALMKDGFTSQLASISVIFKNGIKRPPQNTNTFTPTSGTTPPAGQPYTLVAAGDGADGATNSGNVTNLINSWNPNLFLYLGDVYENGTSTEYYNWYGAANTFYGTFKPITDPIVGNHEYTAGVAPGYFDYWNNVPNYYSYNAAGWHFIALNSNCGLLQNCAVGQAQYNWLLNDLNTHNNQCTIAYFHHPVFNVGPEGYTTTMNDMWALMAQHGVDIVLTGHDHDYQRWVPLNGSGVPSSTGMTEFVAGTGGHGIQTFIVNDPRMAVGYDTSPYSFGALRLQLNQDGAGFQYINSQGLVLDSGAIPCSGAPTDVTPPSTPTNLTATAHSASQVDLSWTGSTDNVGVVGYDIYRNGSLLTSVGMVTSYSDANTTLGATYNYQIKARDNVNSSAFSNTANITLPTFLFSDGFESGDLSAWTSNANLVVQQAEHYSGNYAARATSNGTVTSNATKNLSVTQTDLYYSEAFKVLSLGSTTSAYLQRFRTTANGSIAGIFISGNTGKLGYRNDVTAGSTTNGPVVSLNTWHQLQTHIHINDTNSLVEVWLDGTLATTLSKTDALGTAPIGKIQLGDSSTSDVMDIVYDEVGVNTSFINTTDSQAPSTPTGLSANATAPNSVNLTWNAASDNISVVGYDLFRDGSLVTTTGTVTSYTDTPVSPNFTYQYQVRARDAAGNTSSLSTSASITTPQDTTPPTITLTIPTTDGVTVNGNVTISADASDDVGVDHVDFLVNGQVVNTIGDGGPYTMAWDSTTLPNGTVAVITAQAVDSSTNTTTSNSRTVTVDNSALDTTPPTLPGNFSATAAGATRVDLSWSASTDNIGVVGYDIYRDNLFVTTVSSGTSYSDTNVVVGTTYQYQVQARDAAGNLSDLTPPAPVTIPAVLFSDGFESGDLSQWTNNGLTVQQQAVLEGLYSAHGTGTGTAPIYAYKQMSTTQNDLYYRTWFKIYSQGATSAYLQRFRTSANGAILGVFVSSTGKLGYRNDAASPATTTTSTTSVSQGVWHQLQTHVHINDTNSLVEVWLDGVQIPALSKTDSLGVSPIGRIQIGDSSAADIYDIAFDEAAYDTSFLISTNPLNTIIDSGPLGLVNSNSASFNFSSTITGPSVSFECSLDSATFGACSSPDSLTGLTDGVHNFSVRVLDGLGGVDLTPATRIWNVDTTPATVSSVTPTDTATDIVLNTSVNATFSEGMNPASITSSDFVLVAQGDTTPIPATVNYSVVTNTATLQPNSPLANATTYVATILSGAAGPTDLAGNSMTSDKTWLFTTILPDTTPPSVAVTAPADGAIVNGSVTLFATATDDVGVDHVDFLINGNIVGTVKTAPYTINWDSTKIANGAAIITAQATDPSNNVGTSTAINVTVANDVTPPSVPTGLAANASSGGQVDLTWTASTDDTGVTGYDIFRNGTLLKSVGTVINYSDKTVGPSTPYQYQLQAKDAAGNISALSSPAVSITTPGGLFSDRFESGGLSNWTTVNGLIVQSQQVYAGDFAARATTSGPVTNALEALGSPQYDLYYDMHFEVLSQDPTSSIYIQRFKKADTLSALGVFVSPTGKLGYRNDIAGIPNTSTSSVSLNTWHEVQTHIHVDSAGGPGLVELWFDGTLVLSQAEALSNTPITQIQLGDSTVGRTYDFAFDDVSAAPFYINPGDNQPPSAPANLNASASAPNIVNLTWGASTDNIGVIGYRVYRDSIILATLGTVTSYTDANARPSTAYSYTVRAMDAANNFSQPSTPATITTPADTTPPTVTLTAPSNGASIGRIFTLTANAADDVGVDHVDFLVNGNVVGTDTSAPYSFDWNSASIPDGAATVTARAADYSNNTTVSNAAAIKVDNTPPDTTITTMPLAITTSTSASFTFTSPEPNVSFGCSLDAAAFSACTSPKAYTTLTNAAHTFQVRAIDAAGNVDATPATWTWTVDTIAPTVLSTAPGTNATNVPPITTVVVTFSEAMNPATITTTSFSLKPSAGGSNVAASVVYDQTTHIATLQPSANLAPQTGYTATLNGGSTGMKDLAGNALTTRSWKFTTSILDTTAPTVSLTAPTNGTKVRGAITLSANASDNVLVASVSFLVNGTVVGTDTTSPYSISWNSASIADGSASITARAFDPSNNAGTSTVSTVTVDNTPPDTSITAGPTGTVTINTASFSFTATEAATFACKLDNGSFTTCTSPNNYTGLAAGAHTFQVRATDLTGNVDATPASQSWTVVTPPDTTITAGPSGTVTTTSASFSFTSTQNGSTFTCSLDGAAFSACSSPKAYTNLANGSHTFQVAATNQGLTDLTPASRTWTINLAPDTTIRSAPTSPTNSTSASFSFTSTQNGSTFTCSLDGAAFSTCSSPKTYSGLASGSHTFQVASIYQGLTDPTPASSTWTIDTIAPTGVAVTAPINSSTVTGQVTINASASDNVAVASVGFYVDGSLLSTDTSSPYSTTWNTNKVSKTTHTIYVIAKDTAGNQTQSVTITVTVK